MKQAMIFAAGLGTRLRPLTDTMPKALVKVGGRPLLEHVILRLRAAGFERIVVNVHHFANDIIYFLQQHRYSGVDIMVSDESEHLLDTGGGLKKAIPFFDPRSPILIHNVDILSNVDLRLLYQLGGERDATLLVSPRKTKRYLLFSPGERRRLVGWTNVDTGEIRSPFSPIHVEDYEQEAFSGIHVFSPSLFPLLKDMPEKFGIIDFYLKICSHHDICGYVKNNLQLMDVGKLDSLSRAEEFLKTLDIEY